MRSRQSSPLGCASPVATASTAGLIGHIDKHDPAELPRRPVPRARWCGIARERARGAPRAHAPRADPAHPPRRGLRVAARVRDRRGHDVCRRRGRHANGVVLVLDHGETATRRSASCATSRSRKPTNARASARRCSPTCATPNAHAARRASWSAPARRHRQPRLLPAVRLPLALDRARLLHPGPRLPARLRAERAARGRHGLDGHAALMGRLRRHRARRHPAARVARLPPAVGGRRHHRGGLAAHARRRRVPGVRAHRLDARGRPARPRHDGPALLRIDPGWRSRRSLRAAPQSSCSPSSEGCCARSSSR